MPRTLLLMRHAKSDWNAPHESDFDRPLNARGERAAPLMAQFIAALQRPPQWIVSSPAVRALRTAEIVAAGLEEVALLEEAELYGAGVGETLAIIRRLPEEVDCALLVGHNPTMEWLVGELSGDPTLEMKTATLAMFEVDGDWAALDRSSCTLLHVQHPRDLEVDES